MIEQKKILGDGIRLSRNRQDLATSRKLSLTSKRTLQQLHRAAATETLRVKAPLFSFKTEKCASAPSCNTDERACTIPAASREQAVRLYRGPTIRAAGAWDAPHDSPGPQAYNESEKWTIKLRNEPSTRISLAKCERDSAIPTTAGPGDYNISGLAVEKRGKAVKFGDPAFRDRYPPRTPDQPRAQVPCSYAEHVSCLHGQVTSNRVNAPTFYFSGLPRFQNVKASTAAPAVAPALQASSKHSRPARPASSTKKSGKSVTKSSTKRHRQKANRRRRKKPRGGPRVFRRGNYDYIRASVEPKPWKSNLQLTDPETADDCIERPSTTTTTTSSFQSCLSSQKTAPRAVLRRGPRHNPAEYNPQNRDLPRQSDQLPGPKYGRTPGAFGRTGAGGGVASLSPMVSALDRFPQGYLFDEEEMVARENTPGPESYDVTLDHRLEGVALEEMRSSIVTLTCWEGNLQGLDANSWPFATASEQIDVIHGHHGDIENEGPDFKPDASGGTIEKPAHDESAGLQSSDGCGPNGLNTCTTAQHAKPLQPSESHDCRLLTKHRRADDCVNIRRTPCSAGGTGFSDDGASVALLPFGPATRSLKFTSRRENRRIVRDQRLRCVGCCSRLAPSLASAATWCGTDRHLPCRDCLQVEASGVAGSFLATASTLSDPNLYRRARSNGASVRFGDMPRQRSAPAFSIGKGRTGVAARLLHTPGDVIYRENHLGRCGLGPSTASPRAGDGLTRPRSPAARVILPLRDPSPTNARRRIDHRKRPQSKEPQELFAAGRSSNGERAEGAPGNEGGVSQLDGGKGVAGDGDMVVDGALGHQVRSCRPTGPSFTLAGPRRTRHLFRERLRYDGQELPATERYPDRRFFNSHILHGSIEQKRTSVNCAI